ncbi:HNH endonuclease [Escherichia coli]|nr:HNH endonuclease [Escherichia coli]
MTRLEKFHYIVKNWYLQDGIVYSRHTRKPVATTVTRNNHLELKICSSVSGSSHVFLHQAVFMLYHNRPVGDGLVIHHIDGNPLNNHPSNLVELTQKQHHRIHAYQCDDPLRGIYLHKGSWRFRWIDDSGHRCEKYFREINDAMKFREEIEAPRRAELRALGLDC